MLEILNVEGLDDKKLNIYKRKTKKKQILLYDTQRRFDDFVKKIKYRKNGNYDDIPHFIVTKFGFIYQLFNTNYSSVTFKEPKVDRKIIKIAIENLGWLNKNTINGVLNNWIGDPYRGEPYIRNWRGHYFWDKYTEDQMKSISTLCEHICDEHNIEKQLIPTQGFLSNTHNFNGVVSKSNFSNIYTDINPSFNYKILFNHAEKNNERI
jgi:hypothetical protein